MAEWAGEFPDSAFPGAAVRAQDLRYLVDCLQRGECCSLVGLSNTGKSILLKSLLDPQVRRGCAREGVEPPMAVFVDCLEAGYSEQAFYELLLRRVAEEVEQAGLSPTLAESVRSLHAEVLRSSSAVEVRSLFAQSARELGRSMAVDLVLILDEFDDIFRTLPPWPFRQLRALRDALGVGLVYVTGTLHRLERLRTDAESYEFRELFHLHTHVLRPLSAEDSCGLVTYLAHKHGFFLTEDALAMVIDLAGGHPGLLESIYSTLQQAPLGRVVPRHSLVTGLIGTWPIQQECQRLWDELGEEEREGLLALCGWGEPALTAVQRQLLGSSGLVVVGEEGRLAAFSPILDAFVQRKWWECQQGIVGSGIRSDDRTGQIWVDDRELTLELSELQRKLVRLLCRKEGALCTHEEIVEEVWGLGAGVSPASVYELVKRVRQKVEQDWHNPRYILTVPGEGYCLRAPG